ncbi:MAG: hypothetical protein KDF54_03510 [Hydrogenophaga sp.]|nr:hypothetical protein [Hydrogenophaga sp.]
MQPSIQPDVLMESLDIDLDSLDHALMDLLTSDWQSLDDELPSEDAPTQPQGLRRTA